jgi:hypothetical protein
VSPSDFSNELCEFVTICAMCNDSTLDYNQVSCL